MSVDESLMCSFQILKSSQKKKWNWSLVSYNSHPHSQRPTLHQLKIISDLVLIVSCQSRQVRFLVELSKICLIFIKNIKIYNTMDKRLAFVWLLALVFTLAASEPTSLSYIIEVEEENGHDFIEMTIKVTAQDPSLTAAITQAKEKT